MVEMLDASGEPGADGPAPRARRRRVNINTDDESEIRELPGVSFIEARRICMERPFQDMHELLNVRGMSRDLVQQWEAGGIDIAFEDPFLAFEKVQQPRRSTAIAPSPAPIPVSPAPTLAPSPAPSNRLQQQAPSSRRPPLPRPRGSQSSPRDSGLPPSGQKKSNRIHGLSPGVSASVVLSPRNGDSSADVEKLVELVYRQQDARLRRIALARLVRTVTLTVNAWRERVIERRRRDELEFGMILRRLRSSLLATLTEWLLFAKKGSRLRRLGVSMLLRVLARYRASAFRHWKMVCGGMSAMGASYANLLARCYTRCLAHHFQAWSEHAAASAHRSRVMIRASSSWLHLRIRSAWNAWTEMCHIRKRLRSLGMKSLFNWLQVRMALMLQLWREYVDKQETIAMLRTKNDARWAVDCLLRCLHHWRYMSSKEVMQNVQKKILMMMRGSLAEAFVGWHEHTVATRRWAIALSRAVAKMERKIAYATFYRWVFTWRRNIQLHETGIQILVTSMDRNLRLIFRGWKHASARSQLWLHVQRKVMKMDTKTLYTQHFNAWRSSVGARYKELQQLIEGWKEYKNSSGREGALLVRLLYAWRAVAQDGLHLRRTGVKILLRWLASGVREMLLRWKIAAHRDRSHANVALRIGLRWTTAELSTVFRMWSETTKVLRKLEIHYARARRRVIWNRKRAIMLEWSVYTYESRRLWHAGSVLLSRWISGVLAQSMSSWLQYVAQHKWRMTKIKVAIARICARDKEHAFFAWKSACEERTNADNALVRAASTGLPSARSHGASTYDSTQSGVTTVSSKAEAVDPWSRVLSTLSAQQRMGIHLMGMQRTWENFSAHFAAWAAVRGSRLRPVNNEPPEPDQAPDLATLNPSLPATRPDDPHKLMHHDLYATHQPLASGYADDWAAPTSPSPSSYAYAPHSSPYAPAQPGGAASPPLDAVVMSNFPRQQFTPAPGQDGQPSPRPSSPAAALTSTPPPRSAGAGATPKPPYLSMSSSMVMSPKPARSSPNSSARHGEAASFDDRVANAAKLGEPVMQSLTPVRPQRYAPGPPPHVSPPSRPPSPPPQKVSGNPTQESSVFLL